MAIASAPHDYAGLFHALRATGTATPVPRGSAYSRGGTERRRNTHHGGDILCSYGRDRERRARGR